MKTWKKWLKRIASTVCAAAMCAAMLPATAFAEGPETFEEKAPEPEPQYTITSFTKERVTEAPENDADGFFHASLLDKDINYDATVNVPTDGNVKLLYKLTVSGNSDACFSIADEGATIVDSNCGANATEGTIYGDIPDDTAAIIYVTKTFTAEDVADGQLTNTATISGEAGSVLSEDLDGDGDGKYTVTASTPATAPEGGGEDKTSYPGLTKEVQTGVDADNNPIWDEATSAAAGSSVTFKLESNVPDDLLNYINAETPDDPTIEDSDIEMYAEGDRGSYILTFHDQMDDAFELDPESFVVKIGDTELALEDEYTVAYNVTHDKDSICDFEIAVDLVNLYASGAIDDADISGATPITVTYSATLKDGTTGGTYDNTSWVTYPGDETAKDTASVYVFDLKIFKYDQATATTDAETGKWTATGLKGAEFALYGEDAVDENGDLKADAEPILEGITSGEDGYATITGLAAGNYILTETKAPDNYVGSTEPFNVEISVSTAGTDYLVEVNFANTKIPHTGGTGTMMYTIGGVAIIVLAGVLLVVYRKSRKKQDR